MKEYIDRFSLLKNLNRFAPEKYDALVNDLIMKEPMAIVQCKDCAEYRDWLHGKICLRFGSYYGNMKPDDYCSYGKKR